jgi:hypothetical protein
MKQNSTQKAQREAKKRRQYAERDRQEQTKRARMLEEAKALGLTPQMYALHRALGIDR